MSDDEKPGVFGVTVVAVPDMLLAADEALEAEREAERVDASATTPAKVSRGRQALRRLQNTAPSAFEQVIDLIYQWKEHAADMQVTDMMRRLVSSNHNMSDANAVSAMKGFIREARMNKVTGAIAQMGLDEAERILGLKKDE